MKSEPLFESVLKNIFINGYRKGRLDEVNPKKFILEEREEQLWKELKGSLVSVGPS